MNTMERKACEKWIIENVTAKDVPNDGGNSEALIFNLVHLLRDGPDYDHYDYQAHQDAELRSWGVP